MREVVFHQRALDDIAFWKKTSPPSVERIKKLLKAIQENPFSGIGKPEPLRHDYSGHWSRRITQEHRLVYRVTDEVIIVISCRFHYG